MGDNGREERRVTGLWKAILAVMAVVISLAMLVSALQPPDPNAQMAETAEQAMEMARDAREDAKSVRQRGYALCVVALVVGVSAPLVVAYLIYRASEQSEPGPAEVLEVMEEEGLLDGPDRADKERNLQYRRNRRSLPERDT